MTDRELVAYHEAGHAVIAELLKLPSKSVSIIPSTAGAGRHLLSTSIGRLEPWRVAVWSLAGPEAEKCFGQTTHARLGANDYTFVRTLLELTRQPTDPDTDALGRRYEAMACAYVTCHAKWIATVAKQLLIEKIFPASVVRDLKEAAI